LEAAEAWGKAPWEITWRPGPLIWWLRFDLYQRLRVEAQKEAIEDMKKPR
jgi:hypothetical protein